jgi:hypothetical protein
MKVKVCAFGPSEKVAPEKLDAWVEKVKVLGKKGI